MVTSSFYEELNLLKKIMGVAMLSNRSLTYWEELEIAADDVRKDAKTICRLAGLPESTRKNLPTVENPHRRTRIKILRTLVSLGWEENRCS